MRTIVTTDSGCNPINMSKMIPCIIIDSNNQSYYDMQKASNDKIPAISNLEIFERAVSGEIFRTSAPNIVDYVTFMEEYLEKDYNIIHLSMSSGISDGSVNSSNMAASILNDKYGDNRVTVIDTLTGGSGGTVLNTYAEELLECGLTTKEIVEKIEHAKHNLVTSFYISKVEGFVKSGRAPVGLTLSDMLSFRYRIDVKENGKLFPNFPVLRGRIHSQFMKWLKTIVNESNIYEYNPYYISLLKTRLNEIEIEEAIKYLERFRYFQTEIKANDFYGAICSYGVEDQVGIGLIKKNKSTI